MRRIILNTIAIVACVYSFTGADDFDMDKKISLQLDDVPISTVLNMIAKQYNLNIVQSTQIKGNLSLKLNDVKLKNALNAILTAHGYNFFLAGDILVIKPLEDDAIGETTIKTITLDYISPEAALNAAEGILSSKGRAKIVKDAAEKKKSGSYPISTRLVIIDLPDVAEKIASLIHEIDRPEPLVAIEVRMVETNLDSEQKTGFKWPTSLEMRAHGIETAPTSTTINTDNAEAMGQIDLPDGRWEWGKLSVRELQLVLEFLETEGRSKLVSDPRITTLNNHEAEIKVTTIVPIQTINRFSEGGSVQDIVTFQDEEVGITLLVTPHITDENMIILDVQPTVAEIIGFSGPPDQQKPITSERSIRTKITVRDGETAVLGGLLKESKIENEHKVFFFGSLPVIGGLFKHKSVSTKTTDLTILITPRIIED